MRVDSWKPLKIFGNKARVHILRLLLKCEIASLSDIVRAIERDHGLKISISGVFKHMKILENAGLIRHESGAFDEEPDARKTIYLLEGKERVEKILQLEEQAVELLRTGLVFKKTAELARRVRGIGPRYRRERKLLTDALDKLQKEREWANLTKEEKEKVKLWRIITKYSE